MADFRTAYSERVAVKADCSKGGRTKQSFKDECDINLLMRRYAVNGVLPQNVGMSRYGDFSDVGDYLEAKLQLMRAQTQFQSLPARVRERFKNDPAQLLAFIADRKNFEEAKRLGLLAEETAAASVPGVPAAAPGAAAAGAGAAPAPGK